MHNADDEWMVQAYFSRNNLELANQPELNDSRRVYGSLSPA